MPFLGTVSVIFPTFVCSVCSVRYRTPLELLLPTLPQAYTLFGLVYYLTFVVYPPVHGFLT